MASVSHRKVAGFVEPPRFADCSEKYKEHIVMERRDGVIMLRMHTRDKALVWSPQLHRAIHRAVHEVSADPENHVC